jgi:hypothetical protein
MRVSIPLGSEVSRDASHEILLAGLGRGQGLGGCHPFHKGLGEAGERRRGWVERGRQGLGRSPRWNWARWLWPTVQEVNNLLRQHTQMSKLFNGMRSGMKARQRLLSQMQGKQRLGC